MTTEPTADWTRGTPGLALQRCAGCKHVWYFHRDFCPQCGAPEPQSFAAAGRGTVHAGTLVHRAPDDEFRALAPYRIVLVALEEGVRVMGHGDPDIMIGDRVEARYLRVANRLIPYFDKFPDRDHP
jgi:uncharacterized protein